MSAALGSQIPEARLGLTNGRLTGRPTAAFPISQEQFLLVHPRPPLALRSDAGGFAQISGEEAPIVNCFNKKVLK